MKPAVVCQLLSKFGIFTFVVSYAMSFIEFFFLKWVSKQDFWWENTKEVEILKGAGGSTTLA